MSRTTTRPGLGARPATTAAGTAGAIALVLCCGGALLAATLGLGALAAFLINPWFLIPVVAAAAGVVYWRVNRQNAACEVSPDEGNDQR